MIQNQSPHARGWRFETNTARPSHLILGFHYPPTTNCPAPKFLVQKCCNYITKEAGGLKDQFIKFTVFVTPHPQPFCPQTVHFTSLTLLSVKQAFWFLLLWGPMTRFRKLPGKKPALIKYKIVTYTQFFSWSYETDFNDFLYMLLW